MKIKEVLNYNQAIKAVVDNAKDVNALVKFRLLGMAKQFEPIVANFDTVREEKIAKYGTTNESGQTGIFAPEKDKFDDDKKYDEAVKEFEETVKKFTNDIDEVLDSEADIEIKKFKYTDIMDSGLPSDYLIAIYDLIEE